MKKLQTAAMTLPAEPWPDMGVGFLVMGTGAFSGARVVEYYSVREQGRQSVMGALHGIRLGGSDSWNGLARFDRHEAGLDRDARFFAMLRMTIGSE